MQVIKTSVGKTVYKQVVRLMGNIFTISVVESDQQVADSLIDKAVAEIKRIEALLTTFNESSQTNLINQNAGIKPVKVDNEVFDLIKRSLRISELTQGAFDISYGSIDKSLWNFDKSMTSLPDAEMAAEMVRLINYRNVQLDEQTNSVFLKEKGMRIGFGGIGKGYAADCASRMLKKLGVKSGIVNAAGDLITWGTQPNGKPWTVGIADPNSKSTPFSYLNISDMAIATSGDYEKFVIIEGKKYSHTIDPKTGFPSTGIKSVTVINPIAELADALATPIAVMGVKVGLDMINQMRNVACIIVDVNDKVYTSNNIRINQI